MSYGVAAGTLRDALTVRRGRTAGRDASINRRVDMITDEESRDGFSKTRIGLQIGLDSYGLWQAAIAWAEPRIRQDERESKNDAEIAIGGWLSAALDDPNVCAQMKLDIVRWFTFFDSDLKRKSDGKLED